MMKATPRRDVLPPPAPSSVRTLEPPEAETPRSARMMDKLRDGLGEYIRFYNPVSTNWRRMKAKLTHDALSGRHSVDLGRRSKKIPSRTGESADLVPPLLFEHSHHHNPNSVVPRLHILNSDTESEDEDSHNVHNGSVRSMPNLTHRGNHTHRGVISHRGAVRDNLDPGQYSTAPMSERSLSTISSDDDDSLYSSRRTQMRQTLKLMGGVVNNSTRNKHTGRTPRLKRLRGRAGDDGTTSDSDLPSSQRSDVARMNRIARRTSRASLDVITESRTTPDTHTQMTPVTSPSKNLNSPPTNQNGGNNNKVIVKRGSRNSLARNASRKSLGDDLLTSSSGATVSQATGAAAPLSKKGSVAALRARRRRQMLASKFRTVCRLFINLYRLWKIHSAKSNTKRPFGERWEAEDDYSSKCSILAV